MKRHSRSERNAMSVCMRNGIWHLNIGSGVAGSRNKMQVAQEQHKVVQNCIEGGKGRGR